MNKTECLNCDCNHKDKLTINKSDAEKILKLSVCDEIRRIVGKWLK